MSKIKYNSVLLADSLKSINQCIESLDNTIACLDKATIAESYYVNIADCKTKVNNSKIKFKNLSQWINNTNTKIDTITNKFQIRFDNLKDIEIENRNNIVNI